MGNSNEYMRQYMANRYHKRRNQAIEKLGGKCVDCGTTENLEFDHVNESDKSFNVGTAFGGMAESKLWDELKKCVLRCRTHHLEKTINSKSVGHGEGVVGKRNCRCSLCAPLKNAYARDLKRRRKETSSS